MERLSLSESRIEEILEDEFRNAKPLTSADMQHYRSRALAKAIYRILLEYENSKQPAD
ncbi:MAG: hypothetical protein ACOX8W_06610 [bacterium]